MSRGVRILVGVLISVVALYFAFPPRSEWGTCATPSRASNIGT
jgi:hypothetical protein